MHTPMHFPFTGQLQTMMHEKQALEARLDNATNEHQKAKASAAELQAQCTQLQDAMDDVRSQLQVAQAQVVQAEEVAAAAAAGLEQQRKQSVEEVQAWQRQADAAKQVSGVCYLPSHMFMGASCVISNGIDRHAVLCQANTR